MAPRGCEPGGGSASFADGFVKGRDVSVLARRLRRGEVRSLALSRARLSSLQWAALAEGVADSVCLREVRLEGVAIPAQCNHALAKWSSLAETRSYTLCTEPPNACKIIPTELTHPASCAAAIEAEVESLRGMQPVDPTPSVSETWTAISDRLSSCRDAALRRLVPKWTDRPGPSDALGAAGMSFFHNSVACGLSPAQRTAYVAAWLHAVSRCHPGGALEVSTLLSSAALLELAGRVAEKLGSPAFVGYLRDTDFGVLRYVALGDPPAAAVRQAVHRKVLPVVFGLVAAAAGLPSAPEVALGDWLRLMVSLKIDSLHPREAESPLDSIASTLEAVVTATCLRLASVVEEAQALQSLAVRPDLVSVGLGAGASSRPPSPPSHPNAEAGKQGLRHDSKPADTPLYPRSLSPVPAAHEPAESAGMSVSRASSENLAEISSGAAEHEEGGAQHAEEDHPLGGWDVAAAGKEDDLERMVSRDVPRGLDYDDHDHDQKVADPREKKAKKRGGRPAGRGRSAGREAAKESPAGRRKSKQLAPLRFAVRQRVLCTIAKNVREPGIVVALRERGMAYRVRLDSGSEVYAPKDKPSLIIAQAER
ncbi:hypothetical protein DIPPA_21286 [Diplonema papillatum]|nr:hypothetical protein DIPPA_21286 [Diplonema papillatum]